MHIQYYTYSECSSGIEYGMTAMLIWKLNPKIFRILLNYIFNNELNWVWLVMITYNSSSYQNRHRNAHLNLLCWNLNSNQAIDMLRFALWSVSIILSQLNFEFGDVYSLFKWIEYYDFQTEIFAIIMKIICKAINFARTKYKTVICGISEWINRMIDKALLLATINRLMKRYFKIS